MTTTLADCADWMSGGTPSKANPAYWTGDIPWVSAKDMKAFRLRDAEDHISPEAVGNGGKMVRAGDILLLVRGMTLHNDVPICMAMRDMAFNQDIKAIRAVPGVDSAFLAYWLLAHKPDLLASVDSAGHGTGRLVTETLKKRPVRLPPVPEQKRIAHILGTLDDKIELNRRMNATLEGISRAIFKSWFVDFDPVRQKAAGKQPVGMDAQTAALFPDSFEDSEIGEVPTGWGVAEVRDFLSLSREAVDPSEHPSETFDHYSIPAFDSGCWPSPDAGADIKSQKLVVASGSVLISKLNPRTPRVWIPPARHVRRPVASTEFLVAVPNKTKGVGAPFVFCFASSEPVVEYLASHASGTSNSHQRVRPDDFLNLRTVLATNAVLGAFNNIVGPHLQRSNHARNESRTLAALRDTLLPKLLSGEVRVPEAEEAVTEAVR